MANKLFRTKSLKQLFDESGEHNFKKVLTATNLTTLGIGAIIGAGIFVLTGQAAAQYAGPGYRNFIPYFWRCLRICRIMLC